MSRRRSRQSCRTFFNDDIVIIADWCRHAVVVRLFPDRATQGAFLAEYTEVFQVSDNYDIFQECPDKDRRQADLSPLTMSCAAEVRCSDWTG